MRQYDEAHPHAGEFLCCIQSFFYSLRLSITRRKKEKEGTDRIPLNSFFFFIYPALRFQVREEEKGKITIGKKLSIKFFPFLKFFFLTTAEAGYKTLNEEVLPQSHKCVSTQSPLISSSILRWRHLCCVTSEDHRFPLSASLRLLSDLHNLAH